MDSFEMIWKYALLFFFVVHQCLYMTDSETKARSRKPRNVGGASKCECGKGGGVNSLIPHADSNSHGVNGLIAHADSHVVPIYRYPFMIHVFVNGLTACGGAIISQRFVLTAAHCFVDTKEEALKRDYFKNMTCKSTKDSKEYCITPASIVTLRYNRKKPGLKYSVNVKRVIPHSGFSIYERKWDISLLETSKCLPCDEYTAPICLPIIPGLYQERKQAILAGWGSKAINEPPPSPKQAVLRQSTFQILSQNVCKNYSKIMDSICVESDTSATCFGDSGSPLFQMVNTRYYVIGIDSFIISNCTSGYPDYYTNVKLYLSWIKQNMKAGVCSLKKKGPLI